MFKLPDCPHCHTIYRYVDVKKNINKKVNTCYHCKKSFKTSFAGLWLLALAVLIVGVLVDIAEITMFGSTTGIALIITNIVLILIFFVFIPFFVSFKKLKNESEKGKSKNRDKNKKQT